MMDFLYEYRSYIIGAGVILALYLAFAWFPVKARTRRIVWRMDNYYRAAEPGWRFRVPFLDKLGPVVDTSIQTTKVDRLEVTTSDNASVAVRYSYGWQIIDPERSHVGIKDCSEYVETAVAAEVSKHVGTIKYEQLKSEGNEVLSRKIKDNVKVSMDRAGVLLDNIRFTNISDIIQENSGNVANKQFQAQIQSESDKIAADSDRQVQKAASEVEAERIAIVGEAELTRLQGLNDFFQCPEKAREFLLESKRIDALRALASAPSAKTIITSAGNFGGTEGVTGVVDVEGKGEQA